MRKQYAARFSWFVAGVLLNSFGVALITKAALGTSPISSLPYVLSFRFPVTLGQFTFVMNMVFIVGQLLLLRRNFRPVPALFPQAPGAWRGHRDLRPGGGADCEPL